MHFLILGLYFDENVFIKVIFLCQKEYTQISSEGAAVSRQAMKHVVRNPCK